MRRAMLVTQLHCIFFFFNDTATTEIYTLSLHDALPIWKRIGWLGAHRFVNSHPAEAGCGLSVSAGPAASFPLARTGASIHRGRSEEHTSELQSLAYLVCRLLLEKKNKDLRFSPSRI